MKKVMFLATLTLASASVFGMDSVPDTGSERKRIQNSEVAPNQKKASMEEEFSELMEAVKSNNLNKVCKIIENHPDKSKIRDLLLYGKNKARLSKDQLEQVRRELYQNSYVTELVNLSDKNGIFPLFVAVQNGYEEIVKYLVDSGADINRENKREETLLFLAVQKGYEEIVKYLVDSGADINRENKWGKTPLFLAVQNGYEEIAKYLIDHGADVNNIANIYRQTPLFWAVQFRHETIAKYLIDHGADVNITNKHGETPLLLAVQKGYETIAKYLIDHGADVNIADKSGNTPLFWAVRQNNSEKKEKYEKIIEILKAAGAK